MENFEELIEEFDIMNKEALKKAVTDEDKEDYYVGLARGFRLAKDLIKERL